MTIPKPKYVYLAYVIARDTSTLIEVAEQASSKFTVKGIDLAIKNFAGDLMVVCVTSDSPIIPQLVAGFEARVGSTKYADILFSFHSVLPVYLFSLFIGYHFDEKIYPISSFRFRRKLTVTAYSLTSGYVEHFYQSSTSTSMVICSEEVISKEDIESLLALTKIKQVSTTISFQNF